MAKQQMKRANKILYTNQNVVGAKPSSYEYYGVAEKTITETVKGDKSTRKATVLLSTPITESIKFRGQAVALFTELAKEHGASLKYIGIYN